MIEQLPGLGLWKFLDINIRVVAGKVSAYLLWTPKVQTPEWQLSDVSPESYVVSSHPIFFSIWKGLKVISENKLKLTSDILLRFIEITAEMLLFSFCPSHSR